MDILQREFLEWCSALEKETTQCYFCHEKFTESIYSCDSGHNICSSCKVELCLACKLPKPLIRNHLAELLITRLTNLKNQASKIKRKDIKPETAYALSQTAVKTANKMSWTFEKDMKKSEDIVSENNTPEIYDPDDNSNMAPVFYPCLNKYCKFVGVCADIIAHIESNHSSQYEQDTFQQLPYTKSWEFDYTGDNTQVIRVVNIKKLGLFVLHIFINKDGELKGSVLLYNIRKHAQKYEYNLEIECDGKKISQSLVVDTCRIPERILYGSRNGLFISKNALLYNSLKSKLKYKCFIEIKESTNIDNNVSNQQNQIRNTHVDHKTNHKKQSNQNRKNDNQQRKSSTNNQEGHNSYTNNNNNNQNQSKQGQWSARGNRNNQNNKTNIPSLLNVKPSLPNTMQYNANQMPGSSSPLPGAGLMPGSLQQGPGMVPRPPLPTEMYPDLQQFTPLPVPGAQQYPSGMNNTFRNVNSMPTYCPRSSPPPQAINHEMYHRNTPVYEQTHFVSVHSSIPSAPVVDPHRQEIIKAGVEAVQQAHLQKHGIQSSLNDTLSASRDSDCRGQDNNRSRRRNSSKDRSKDTCVIS